MLESFGFITVFLEGLISFFSPCIIPIIPLYMSYLAGSAKTVNEDGTITYKRKTTLLHTLFFVLGISASFFILGLSFTAIGSFFNNSKYILLIICGILIIVMGLFQTGIIKIKFLQKEKKINANINIKKMNPFFAFILGFLFSFAWTPCVGPALSSVLIMASSADSMLLGNILVFIYALGFIIPFLILGLFTGEVLSFLKKKQNILDKVVKVGGILLILVGAYILFTNVSFTISSNVKENCGIDEETGLASCKVTDNNQTTKKSYRVSKFTLKDQNNNIYEWKDYKDKVVLLHFWATDCVACKRELKELDKLYSHYNENKDDVILLTVLSPKLENKSKKHIKKIIEERNIKFPVLIDETGEFFSRFEIISYPNTFIVKDSIIKLTIPGASTYERLITSVNEVIDEK